MSFASVSTHDSASAGEDEDPAGAVDAWASVTVVSPLSEDTNASVAVTSETVDSVEREASVTVSVVACGLAAVSPPRLTGEVPRDLPGTDSLTSAKAL